MGEKNAVVLLSGGLDSATMLGIAKAAGFAPHALTVRYGQSHAFELEAAARVAESAGVVEHRFLDIDLRQFGGSALTGDGDVPTDRPIEEMSDSIPITYVPARNTVFLSLALAWAEVISACDIFIGVNALDYGGYPDCRPEYIAAFESMARLATKAGVESDEARLRIHTPLIQMTKAEIIARGLELGVDYSLSSTCYAPTEDGLACGRCDACLLRLDGFSQVGVKDPIRYVS